MSNENQEDTAADLMNDLFGPPPLMKGEDAARYWRLHAAIVHEIKPETVFDKIRVREFTDKLWQQQRCKQSATSIVEGAYIEALASLLRPFNPAPMISIDEDAASVMAREYYSGEITGKEEAEMELRLAQYRITQEQIRATAMQLCGSAVMTFYRMENHCETSLRMLRKEHERRAVVENDAKDPGPDQR
jgi:hypothetical protein